MNVKIKIVTLDETVILDDVVDIHRNAFDGYFTTTLGDRFLHKYYSLIVKDETSLCVVAESDKGEVLGFVCGSVDPKSFYSKLKKQWHACLWPVLVILLTKSEFRRAVIKKVLNLFKSGLVNPSVKYPDCVEIFSLAVQPNIQSRGVGRLMLEEFMSLSAKIFPNSEGYLVVTDHDNERLGRFYKNIGFKEGGNFLQSGDRVMAIYSYASEA